MVREGEHLEVQDFGDAEQAIEPDTEGMGGELGGESGDQPPQAMGVIGLDVKLEGELAVDRLDQLAQVSVEMAKCLGGLRPLISARHGDEMDVAARPQISGDCLRDVRLVGEDVQVAMRVEQFRADREIGQVGRGEFKVADDAALGEKQMQLVAKERLLFRGALAERGSLRRPFLACLRCMVELHDGHG